VRVCVVCVYGCVCVAGRTQGVQRIDGIRKTIQEDRRVVLILRTLGEIEGVERDMKRNRTNVQWR
jgi:hypothetical protein